jgi:hypothetical protein
LTLSLPLGLAAQYEEKLRAAVVATRHSKFDMPQKGEYQCCVNYALWLRLVEKISDAVTIFGCELSIAVHVAILTVEVVCFLKHYLYQTPNHAHISNTTK